MNFRPPVLKRLTMLKNLLAVLVGCVVFAPSLALECNATVNATISGDHTCSEAFSCENYYWTTIQVSTTESYLTQSGWWIFKKDVTRYRIRYKMIPKRLASIQYKMGIICCDGYVEDQTGHRCIPECPAGCLHGRCLSPRNCSCDPGYVGQSCSLPCPEGKYGIRCIEVCRCLNGATCDHVNGSCRCAAGWTGEFCDQLCPDGFYGRNCQQKCDCRNGGKCFHIDGSCLCPAGFEGEKCESSCREGFFGLHCSLRCQCENSISCDHITGQCACSPGWQGVLCNQPCPPGKYGDHCRKNCNDVCRNFKSCDPVNGTCVCKPGYVGARCNVTCPARTFGDACSQSCSCLWNNTRACDGTNGFCLCAPGWTREDCGTPCGPGHNSSIDVAESCTWDCNCSANGICQETTGKCFCSAGYTGTKCDRQCSKGTFGYSCAGICSCVHGICSPVNGSCACGDGWTGPRCDLACPVGYYGQNCQKRCLCSVHGVCNRLDGSCSCTGEFQGQFCDEKCENWTFGLGCTEKCICSSNNSISCHGMTGDCSCKLGWTGVSCREVRTCPPWRFGAECKYSCLCETSHTAKCDYITGKCLCKPGYTGPRCEYVCPAGTFGQDCLSSCNCAHGGACNPSDGSCNCTAGFQGILCNEPCPVGTFGYRCRETCDCMYASGCDNVNGDCECKPGWEGDRCDEVCSRWFYGEDCMLPCSCPQSNAEGCHHIHGTCRCKPGFYQDLCTTVCAAGWWGLNCSNICRCEKDKAKHEFTCSPVDGQCDCNPGWTSKTCADSCPARYFGSECTQRCPCNMTGMNGDCHNVNGQCYCSSGWTGQFCNETCPVDYYGENCVHKCSCDGCDRFTGSCKQAALVGILKTYVPAGIGALLLIVLVVAISFVYRRRISLADKRQPDSISKRSLVGDDGIAMETLSYDNHSYVQKGDLCQKATRGKLDSAPKAAAKANPIYEHSKDTTENPLYADAHAIRADTSDQYDLLFTKQGKIKAGGLSSDYHKLGPRSTKEADPSDDAHRYSHIPRLHGGDLDRAGARDDDGYHLLSFPGCPNKSVSPRAVANEEYASADELHSISAPLSLLPLPRMSLQPEPSENYDALSHDRASKVVGAPDYDRLSATLNPVYDTLGHQQLGFPARDSVHSTSTLGKSDVSKGKYDSLNLGKENLEAKSAPSPSEYATIDAQNELSKGDTHTKSNKSPCYSGCTDMVDGDVPNSTYDRVTESCLHPPEQTSSGASGLALNNRTGISHAEAFGALRGSARAEVQDGMYDTLGCSEASSVLPQNLYDHADTPPKSDASSDTYDHLQSSPTARTRSFGQSRPYTKLTEKAQGSADANGEDGLLTKPKIPSKPKRLTLSGYKSLSRNLEASSVKKESDS